MAESWFKNLRGGSGPGDCGATPRPRRPPIQPANDKAEKARPEKPPGVQPRGQTPATSRKALLSPLEIGESHSKADSPTRPASVYSGDGEDGTEDFENDSVRVFVRVRPPTEQELGSDKHERCLSTIGSTELQLAMKEKQNQTHRFVFDQVLPEDTKQQDVFELAGGVAVDNCLAGYNSSIFAYGQTGAGKTFTVIGQINNLESRGLAPRVFEYLFAKITDHENARGPDAVKYSLRCCFLEIYNETIADLLCPNANNLPIREDPEKGPYVDGLSEPPALNVDEMLGHLMRGAENRHTGETRLNRESSRSHSVFMCTVEKTVTCNGVSKCFYAKLNLVDLAGSERIASGAHGGSNATGEHFKEACHINKSLTALGRVTTELVKSQKNGGGGHVPYRDSKLTFLLQSSLGGNAKTLIIANVSPSSICAHETLSTLRFAKQTKHIRNEAKINWTVQGDRLAMQREIDRLKMELSSMKQGITGPLVQANEELSTLLKAEQEARERLQQDRDRANNAASQLRRELRVLDQRLVGISGLDGSRGAGVLSTVVEQLELLDASSSGRLVDIAEAERQVAMLQLQAEQEHRTRVAQQLHASVLKCDLLSAQLAALIKEKTDLEESCSVLAENFAQAGARITEQKEQLQSSLKQHLDQKEQLQLLHSGLQDSKANAQQLQQQLEEERSARQQVERQLEDTRAQHRTAVEEAERAVSHGSDLQARLDDKQMEYSQQASRMEGLERQLEGALTEVQALQTRLAETQDQLAQTQRDGSASSELLSEQVQQLTDKLEDAEGRAQQGNVSLDESQQHLQSVRDELLSHKQRLAELEAQLQSKADEHNSAVASLQETASAMAAEAQARNAAEAESASLSSQLTVVREQLSASESRCADRTQLLKQKEEEAAKLGEQLSSNEAALSEANAQKAAALEDVAGLKKRAEALETSADERVLVHAALAESLQKAEQMVVQMEETVAGLQAQLGSAESQRKATEECVVALQSTVTELQASTTRLEAKLRHVEADKAELEARSCKQTTDAQDMTTATARLEARIGELESSKQSLAQELIQEQAAVSSLRDTIAKNNACISETRDQLQQEEARANNARREMAESAAASQRQMAQLEEQQLRDVQVLKDELDRRNADLKARDQEMVRTNFALKGEIDRLQASLEQAKRESVASKANQEQLVSSHQATLVGIEQRLHKQVAHNKELMVKQDALKQHLDHAQREVESWKQKSERLDGAMSDVTRLIRFARNPPDSARSSLIMTRSDHLSPNVEVSRGVSCSRNGFPTSTPTAGALNPSLAESPIVSPRFAQSRYTAGSPAGSKVGSVNRSRVMIDEGYEWSSRCLPDIVSPGDQLPIPDADE